MKRYPNDPMFMSEYDFYDNSVSVQRSNKPSIYVPNANMPNTNMRKDNHMHMPNDNHMHMPNVNIPNNIQMPMPVDEDDDYDYDYDKEEADKNYMISMYPDLCKRIQFYVDEECDLLDYDGSIMYDDYPDKETILELVGKIYVKLEKDNLVPKMTNEVEAESDSVDSQQYSLIRNNWLWDNVQVQFLNELFGRRRFRYPGRFGYPIYPYRYRYFRRYPKYPYFPYQTYVPYNYRYYY